MIAPFAEGGAERLRGVLELLNGRVGPQGLPWSSWQTADHGAAERDAEEEK